MSGPTTVHERFRLVASENATKEAVIGVSGGPDADLVLTYGELDARSSAVAKGLLDMGVEAGEHVGFFFERNVAVLVSMLGVLKAGCAMVALDPAYPAARLKYTMHHSGARAVVAQENVEMPHFARVSTLRVRRDGTAAPGSTSLPVGSSAMRHGGSGDDDAVCYTIYTSGSTGQPKGVMVPHRAACFFLTHSIREWVRPGDVLMAVTSVCFDISVLELLGPLLCGATVVVAAQSVAANPATLAGYLSHARPRVISVMQATPSTWQMLLAAGWEGQRPTGAAPLRVICGGDALPRALARRLAELSSHQLINAYGPTEATVWASSFAVDDEARLSLLHEEGGALERSDVTPIGRALPGRELMLVKVSGGDGNGDGNGGGDGDGDDGGDGSKEGGVRLVEVAGEIGELCIAGSDGLALGYLGDREKTSKAFRRGVLSGQDVLYHTGDLCTHHPDLGFLFRGRKDFQVKVRGFRIELGEIERVAEESGALGTGVTQAVVVASTAGGGDGGDGSATLVAFVVPKDVELRRLDVALRASLPYYMMPTAVVRLASLPLTANRKVDRKSLMAFDFRAEARAAHEFVAPDTATERLVAEIWSDVLRLDAPVSANDDFYALGGSSVSGVMMLARVQQALRADKHPSFALKVSALPGAPVLSAFAATVDAAAAASGPAGDAAAAAAAAAAVAAAAAAAAGGAGCEEARLLGRPLTPLPEHLEVVPLTKELIPATVVAARAFIDMEPMCRVVMVPAEEWDVFIEAICEEAMPQGLSLVVRDRGSGAIVGCMLSEDMGAPAEPPEGVDLPRLSQVLGVVEAADKKYVALHGAAQPGELAHLFVLWVHDAHDGLSMGARLVQESELVARRKGYSGMIAECTHVVSQTIYNDEGLTEKACVRYDEFELEDGSKPFEAVPAVHTGVKIMAKKW